MHKLILRSLLLLACIAAQIKTIAQPGFTANQQVTPYTAGFHAGVNNGYFPGFTNEQLAEFSAGNLRQTIPGAGARTMRFGFTEEIGELFGYDILLNLFDYYDKLGMNDHCVILSGPVDWHRDETFHCPSFRSAMFKNLYTPIWDGGANGTPYNDDNYFAAYCHKMATLYKNKVKFWEIWNEPGFDFTGSKGWLPPDHPGNWWVNNPDPCDYILRAPVQQYIRTLRIAWEVIKTVDPQAYVTCSGVGYPAFLDAVLRQTDNPAGGSVSAEFPLKGGAYFDAVGFHSYPHFDGSVRFWDNSCQCMRTLRHSDGAADGMIDRAWLSYQNVLTTHGYGTSFPQKVRVITEGNVPAKSFVWGTEVLAGGVELQRNFIIKGMVNLMKNNFARYDLYQIFNLKTLAAATEPFEVMGLYELTPSGQIPVRTQEGIAYKTVNSHLFSTTFDATRTTAMNLPANVGGGAFRTPGNRFVYVLWAKTQTDQSESAFATYSFPVSLGVSGLGRREWDFSQTGTITPSGTTNLNLTGAPIFLTDDAAWAVTQPNNNPKIDLQLSMSANPTNPVAGGNTTWSLTVTNNSTVNATNVKILNFLEFGKQFLLDRMSYVSHTAPPGTTHTPLNGTWTIPSLPAGQSLTLQLTARVVHTGPYRAFAQVGAADQPDNDSSPLNGQVVKIPFEDDEADFIINNNGFMDTKADMVIEATTLPGNVAIGATFTTTFMLRNNGRANNPPSSVKYYLSTDNAFSANDVELGTDNFPFQNAFGYETKIRSLTIPGGTSAGNYFILFRADALGQVDEFDENNFFARPITVGAGGTPCTLSAVVSNVVCNDAGTPTNPSDDTFTFDVLVSKNGNCGTTWSGGGTTGSYGVAKNFGPFLISGGNRTLTFNDLANPSATTSVTATAPQPCSTGQPCTISAAVSNVVCNNAGTPTNPSDDTFTFDVLVSKNGNCGTTWSGGGTTGSYGVAKNFGPFLISSGNRTLTFNDLATPTATTSVTATAPPPCSSGGGTGVDLELTASAANPNPAQWSFFSVVFSLKNNGTVAATNVRCQMIPPTGVVLQGGNEFTASQGSYQTFGTFFWTVGTLNPGATATLTLNFFNLTASGKAVYGQVNALDQTDSDSQPNNGTPPTPVQDDEAAVGINGGGGGPTCSISAVVSNVVCNNAGTPTLPGDDTFTFDVLVSKNGAACGTSWSGGGTTGSYGVAKNFGPFLISGGNRTLNFNDLTTPTATASVTATAPQPCSGGGGGNQPDLELTVSAAPQSPGQWKNVTLTLTIRNTGTVAAAGVLVDFLDQSNTAIWSKIGFVSHTAPAGTSFNSWTGRWTVGTIAPGQSLALTYNGFTKVATAIACFGQVAAQSPADADSNPGNNTTGTPLEDDEALTTVNGQNLLQPGDRQGVADFENDEKLPDPGADLFLFPNPAQGEVTVIFPENWVGKTAEIQVLDSFGRTVFSKKEKVAETRNLQLTLNGLADGVYSVRASRAGVKSFTKRLVVGRL